MRLGPKAYILGPSSRPQWALRGPEEARGNSDRTSARPIDETREAVYTADRGRHEKNLDDSERAVEGIGPQDEGRKTGARPRLERARGAGRPLEIRLDEPLRPARHRRASGQRARLRLGASPRRTRGAS